VLQRSSVLSDRGVYEQSGERQAWALDEIHLRDLPPSANDSSLADMCKTFGHHVVRVRTSWNPVSDRCGGQATVLLRSNPGASSTERLIQYLEGKVH
jgi:hypothetical protein